MSKLFVYLRVSTGGQTYEQQMQTISEHFRKMGSDVSNADEIVEEHVSGGIDWVQRKLHNLVKKCKDGDTVFVSELSRLGRDQANVFSLVDYATKKGITLYICKDNIMLENKTQGGKMMLFFYSMQAEAERTNTIERNLARAAWEREQIAINGGFLSKSGRWETKQGRPPQIDADGNKYYDMSAACEAAAHKRTDDKIKWKEQSAAYKWTMDRIAENMPRKEIVRLFNEQHKYDPTFCTRSGKPLSEAILSGWVKEANPLVLAG